MRHFMTREITSAFRRLKQTLVLIAKVFFIAFVNVLFWFLPFVFMIYLAVKPILRMVKSEASQSPYEGVPPVHESKRQNPINLERTVSQARSIWRDVRLFRRT